MSLMSSTWLVRCLSTNIFDAPATVFLHVWASRRVKPIQHWRVGNEALESWELSLPAPTRRGGGRSRRRHRGARPRPGGSGSRRIPCGRRPWWSSAAAARPSTRWTRRCSASAWAPRAPPRLQIPRGEPRRHPPGRPLPPQREAAPRRRDLLGVRVRVGELAQELVRRRPRHVLHGHRPAAALRRCCHCRDRSFDTVNPLVNGRSGRWGRRGGFKRGI